MSQQPPYGENPNGPSPYGDPQYGSSPYGTPPDYPTAQYGAPPPQPPKKKTGLIIRAQEKSYGPPFLDLGLLANNTSTDDTEVNLLARLTLQDVGRADAEWRSDFSLG